ncbi:WYL domain-containing protein [uncultured Desulfobulbus sp.]|uniref:helix-turn-helix transcriptional regulator n=1 Tax=uncultured Desulfobulbus sp. TaxID=239745 RepID=UPI0029C8E86C|nr:WYL domain-containing protein [uncultured Desulfobulbus sp.]
MTLDEQFARLIEMHKLIEDQPYKWDVTAFELRFSLGHATVERDLRILRKWATIKRKKGYLAIEESRFLPVSLTPREMLALSLAGQLGSERIGMPYSDALESALMKVNDHLPKQLASSLKKMKERVSIGIDVIRECNSDFLDAISRAITNHNPVDIKYFVVTRNELTSRRINPYGLTFRFGAWYLIGWCHLRKEVRTFGVDRIREIKIFNDHFAYPTDFNLNDYLSHGWSLQADGEPEHIKLKFSKEITPWISGCRFHPNQKVTAQPDGSSIFEVTVAGIEEIKHWILSYGRNVEVIGPETLRKSIADICSEMAGIYEKH